MAESVLRVEAGSIDELMKKVEKLLGPEVFQLWISKHNGGDARNPRTVGGKKEWPRWGSEQELIQFYRDTLDDDQRRLINLVVESDGEIARHAALERLQFGTMKLAGVFSGIVNNAHSSNHVSPIKRTIKGPGRQRYYQVTNPEYLDWLRRAVRL